MLFKMQPDQAEIWAGWTTKITWELHQYGMTAILELWDVFPVIATARVVTPSLPEAKDS